MKNWLKIISVLTIAAVFAVGCSSGSKNSTGSSQSNASPSAGKGSDEKQVTLRLGHVWPGSEIHAQSAKKFAEEVEKNSNGSIKIEVYEDGTLGSDKDLLEGLKVGTADIWAGGAGTLSGSSNTAKIFTVPFLFDDQAHFQKVYDGEVGQMISDKIATESGYKVLSYWDRGARWLTVNKEVNVPADMSGLKIRVPDSPVFVKSFQRLSAAPTPMAFGEVFTSLQQGVIDGQENPLSLIYASKFNEVVDYLVQTEHVREPISLVISDSKFNSLSATQQQVLLDAAKGAAKQFARDEIAKGDSEFLQKLVDSGMKHIKPDIAAFQAALDGFVDTEFPEIKDVFEQVRAAK